MFNYSREEKKAANLIILSAICAIIFVKTLRHFDLIGYKIVQVGDYRFDLIMMIVGLVFIAPFTVRFWAAD